MAHEGENAKVAIPQYPPRCDAAREGTAEGKEITEDEERKAEDDVQKLTDKFVKDVDVVAKAKEDELMALEPARVEGRLNTPQPVPPPDNVELSTMQLPRHVAIVMDGNGPGPANSHRPRSFGHRAGQRPCAARSKPACGAALQR